MITYLRGEVITVEEKRLVIETGGIGYQIAVSARDALRMPAAGEQVKIHTYMSVREDDISLFGFLDEDDLQMYRLLIGVSGIGPKVGLSVLSVLSADELRYAVLTEDAKAIGKAPGVGPKMAKKLIIELKDKVDATALTEKMAQNEKQGSEAFEAAKAEAIDVLTALGYTRSEAVRAVRNAQLEETMDSDQILSAALADRR